MATRLRYRRKGIDNDFNNDAIQVRIKTFSPDHYDL